MYKNYKKTFCLILLNMLIFSTVPALTYDKKTDQIYDLLYQQINHSQRRQLLKLQETWQRYQSQQCQRSIHCITETSESHQENLNALLTGKLELPNSKDFVLHFDINGEIKQPSYDLARDILLLHNEETLNQMSEELLQEKQHAYELYNAYLYDYCALLSQITPNFFLNCQIKGLMDYPQHR